MKKSIFLLTIAVTALLINHAPADSESQQKLPAIYYRADIKLGALLYDNWLAVKDIRISTNHPLYPLNFKKKGSVTWRCKECHGWDYMGNEGRYGDGPHFTGIQGVYDARNKSPEELYDAITTAIPGHNFTEKLYLSVTDIWSLVKFIREGLVDIHEVINYLGVANGKIGKGKRLYGKYCAKCHGADGGKIDFREDMEGTHGVGWESIADPRETLHKIRWGHPGSDMPSAIIDDKLSDEESVHILSYCQTLYP
jgi:thiosulfate dehydrogenase